MKSLTEFSKPLYHSYCSTMVTYYQHALSLIFAIHEINRNSRLLPNITLGFHLYDDMFTSGTACESILDLLFIQQKCHINYKCDRKDVLSVVGGFTKETSIQMAKIVNIYKIPQVCACVCVECDGILFL